MAVYKVGDRVFLTIRKGTFVGIITHISAVKGVEGPYIVEYHDEDNKKRTHNATESQIEVR